MRSIVAIAGLAACAHTPEATLPNTDVDREAVEPTASNPADLFERVARIDGQVRADLELLEGLEVFEVGALIGGDASQAFNCYGPCEGAEQVVDDYESRAEALRDLTETAMAEPSDAVCDMDAVDTHLDALRALEIVEVGAFISQQAAPSPYCYNMTCPGDEAAAHEVNCASANTLAGIVQAISGQ